MTATAGGPLAHQRTWIPDREIFMRSQGQVRFIKVTSRVQMTAASVLLAALVAWGLSLAVMGWLQYRAAADRMSLLEREAKVATSEETPSTPTLAKTAVIAAKAAESMAQNTHPNEVSFIRYHPKSIRLF